MTVDEGHYLVSLGARVTIWKFPNKEGIMREETMNLPFEAPNSVRRYFSLLHENYCRGAGEEGE
jgi:hypothetical protein